MKTELHCHSSFSGGLLNPIEILRHSEKIGLGAIAITDHDLKALKIMKNIEPDIIYIPGIEIKGQCHVLCLGIEEMPAGKTIPEIVNNVQSSGGIAILAHPYSNLFRSYRKDFLKIFDAVEVVNGLTLNRNNEKAMELAKKLRMSKVSGSNAKIREDIGKFACEVPGNTMDAVLKNIKNKKARIPNKETKFREILNSRIRKTSLGTVLFRKSLHRPVL